MAEQTYAMIKPDAVKAGHVEGILGEIQKNGFTVVGRKDVQLTMDQAREFYKEHAARPFYNDLCNFMTSGPIVALVLEKENAIKEWRALMGPTNSHKAREEAPNSIRAKFGIDGQCNATHGSDSPESAARETAFFGTLGGTQQTYAMIKPDAVKAGHVEGILGEIQKNGFTVVERKDVQLTMDQAREFYKEHAARPFYNDLCNFMTSGPIVALVLEKENAIKEWRALMGPTNSHKAREEAPNSIRARFGIDGQCNATHGSDSPESAARETGFFKTL